MNITQLITRTLELDEAATQGQLRAIPIASLMNHPMFALRVGPDGIKSCIIACELTEPDARLFAEYRTAAPLLAKECQRLQSELDEAREELNEWMTGIASRDDYPR